MEQQKQNVTLNQVINNESRIINNPADMLPKKEVALKDSTTDALGDLALVIQRENKEADAIAEKMKADMQKARAMGRDPEFKTDALATEGLQPININRDLRNTNGIDSNIPTNGPIKAEASDALDVDAIQSVTNYIKPPTYVNDHGDIIDPVTNGPRSVLIDSGAVVSDQNMVINNNPNQQPKGDMQVDPDDDVDVKKLLGDDFVDSFEKTNESKVTDNTSVNVVKADTKESTEIKEVHQENETKNNESENTVNPENIQSEDPTGEIDDESEFEDIEAVLNKDEIIGIIKSKVAEKLRPAKIDLSTFTVQNPLKVVNLVTNSKDVPSNTIDWYLPTTGVNITMKKFDGNEIVALSGSTSNKSIRNANLELLQLIYDHIVNINKPTFEIWIKSVAMEDLEHLYFAVMMATFKDANYITYACPNRKCKDIDVISKSFDEMIHFYDDKQKEEFYEHIQRDSYVYTMDAVEMERVQLTEDYCIDLKIPSLYDVLIEPTYLTEAYRNKHQEKLSIMDYIGTIYRIDRINGSLIPVDYSLNTEDNTLIIKNKFRLYMQFLNSLNSDDYSTLTSLINKIAEKKSICEFIVPKHICEKCGTEIPAKRSTALRLLFTRHQLPALANI